MFLVPRRHARVAHYAARHVLLVKVERAWRGRAEYKEALTLRRDAPIS